MALGEREKGPVGGSFEGAVARIQLALCQLRWSERRCHLALFDTVYYLEIVL